MICVFLYRPSIRNKMSESAALLKEVVKSFTNLRRYIFLYDFLLKVMINPTLGRRLFSVT